MHQTVFKKLISCFVAFAIMASGTLTVSAATVLHDETDIQETPAVFFGEDYIEEKQVIMLNDQPTEIVRTTYCDDTVIWKVTQNGNTETASTTGDYSVLYNDLMYGSGQSVSTFDRVSGYDYEYMKTETETVRFTPEADDAAGSLSVLSIIMGLTGLPYANAVAVAAFVVSHWGADYETELVITYWWYRATASGQFVSYHCEYVVSKKVKVNNQWISDGSCTGDFDTLSM